MSVAPGTRLGPYEIVAPLGAGGMGEVYRARDTRLAREVAIKVLPEALASDQERLKRFEKESRSASALNHPNIVTIHDIGSEGGVSYIAMELVDGATLRELLAGGALPIKKLLQIAPQIAEGLARAHEAGIVHRDLKPENVMVKKDGLVKILDFGLAKLSSTGSGSGEGSQLPTMTGTQPGVVVGTVSYMSPEQASGQTLDFRSDQFSLGAMLYEMATGRRAFQRKTAIDTLSAILNEEPEPIATVAPQTPAPLRWIVERCLAKDTEGRYFATRDLARDLASLRDHLTEATSGVVASVERPRTSRRRLSAAFAAAVALVVAGAASQRWAGSRASIEAPQIRQLTFRRGNVISARFAPDGRTIVYSAAWDGAPVEILTARTDSTESRPIGLRRAIMTSVSSKGEIAVLLKTSGLPWDGPGTLARIPIGGGTPREVLDDVVKADWAPNGEDLAIARVLHDGKVELQYPIGNAVKQLPDFGDLLRVSPSGEILAIARGDSIVTIDRKGSEHVVSSGWKTFNEAAWSPKGDEILVAGSRSDHDWAIWAVSLSGRLRIVANLTPDMTLYDVAADGRILVELAKTRFVMPSQPRGETGERDLAWLDGSFPLDISEDGRLVLFKDLSELGASFVRRTDGTPPIRLGGGDALSLTPDGRSVLALTKEGLSLVPIGVGSARKIPIEGVAPRGASVLPNNKGFLVMSLDSEKNVSLSAVGPAGGKARPIRLPDWDATRDVLTSPDGNKIAYVRKDRHLQFTSLVANDVEAVPGDPLDPEEFLAQWSADGRFIYAYVRGGQGSPARVDRVEIATGRRDLWKNLMPTDSTGLINISTVRIARDAQSYVYWAYRVLASNLYVIEGLR